MGRNLSRHRILTGFTIIELLIVIAVIAILAAIVIGSYAGVQTRAKAAMYADSLNSWEQILNSHYQATGSYPSSETGGTVWPVCLGPSFPADGTFAEEQCVQGGYDYSRADWLDDRFDDQTKPLPLTVLPIIAVEDIGSGTQSQVRGLLYASNPDGSSTYIEYYIDKKLNDGQCVRGDTLEYANYDDDIIRCRRYLEGG